MLKPTEQQSTWTGKPHHDLIKLWVLWLDCKEHFPFSGVLLASQRVIIIATYRVCAQEEACSRGALSQSRSSCWSACHHFQMGHDGDRPSFENKTPLRAKATRSKPQKQLSFLGFYITLTSHGLEKNTQKVVFKEKKKNNSVLKKISKSVCLVQNACFLGV